MTKRFAHEQEPRQGGALSFWAPQLLMMALGGYAWLSLSFPAFSQDTWYYLKTGQALFELKGFPNHELYGQGTEGQPWQRTAWAFSLGTWLLWHWGGFKLMILTRIAFATLTLLYLYRQARQGLGATAAAVGTALALETTRLYWTERPQIFSYAFFILAAVWLNKPTASFRRGALFVLALAWSNLHDSSVLFGLLAWFWLMVEIWLGRRAWRANALDAAWIAAGLLCNPGFSDPWMRAFNFYGLPEGIRLLVPEWSPPSLAQAPLLFATMAAGAGAASWQARRRGWQALSPAGLWALAFATLTLQSQRYAPYFMLLALLWAGEQTWPSWRRPRVLLALSLGLLALLGLRRLGDPQFARYEPLWEKFPVGAAEYLAKDPPTGRLANFHFDGDYLLWRLGPDQKVFIDSRQDLHAVRYVHEQRLYGALPGWQEVVQGYGFSAILVPLLPAPPPLQSALAREDNWALVYQDASSALWAKRGERGSHSSWKPLNQPATQAP